MSDMTILTQAHAMLKEHFLFEKLDLALVTQRTHKRTLSHTFNHHAHTFCKENF